MGIFDDLIPADEVGLFDDLLPRKEPEKLRVSPGDMPEADGAGDIPQDDPTPSSLGMRSAQRQTSLSPQVGGPRTAPPAEPVTPEPVVNRGNPDTTDDARAERGFGRSAYLDDGAMPDVQPNAVTRTAQRPADPPPMAAQAATRDDPFEGEGFGSLAKRRGQQAAKGATEVIASVPEALAILDRDITRQRYGSALDAVPALRKEREDLNRIIADTEKDDPRNRAARMRLTNVEGEILRAANMVREDSASLETPVEDTGMFGVGGKIRQSSEDVFGAPDPRDTSFWAGVAEGAGNMTALAGASIIAGPAGLGVGAGLGSSLNSSQIYKEARAAGVDEETALAASRWAGAIGATEIIPISRALKLLPPRLRPKVSNTLMKRFADIAQGSGEEAAQEYLATVANNLVAQKFYDPERGWDEGAAEGALVGAVLGGGMGLVGSVAGRDGETPASKPPEPQGAPPRPDYGNSPLLTPEDRESPIADDVIGEGKELVDSIVRGETPPRPPQAGVQPLDQGGADVLTPQQSVVQEPSAIDRLSPTPPAQPTPESAPAAAPERATEGVVGRPVEDRPALQMPEPEDREQVGGDDDFFEEEVDGQSTGRMMRIDPETGGVVPVETQVAPEAVEPQQESNDQAQQAAQPTTPVRETSEDVETPQPATRRAPKERTASRRRPLTDEVKAAGIRIDPEGIAGQELRNAGITPQNTPGLFKRGGRADIDNIEPQISSYLAETVQADETGNYLDRNDLMNALIDEANGRPRRDAVESNLSVNEAAQVRAQSGRDSDFEPEFDAVEIGDYFIPARDTDISTDNERSGRVREAVRRVENEKRTILTASERKNVYDRLERDGGDVEDIIIDEQIRSALNEAGIEDFQPQRQDRDRTPADAGDTGQPEVQRGSQAESSARPEYDERGRGEPERKGPEITGERRDVGDEREGWIIRQRDTGEVVMETRDRDKIDAINADRYEAVPVREHLADLNGDTPAARAAGQSPDAQTDAVSRAISEPATERTEAGEQQVIPGAEQDVARSESAREADQRREVGARQQQSRMRSATPQDEPGGLFDTQGDMLDQAEQDEAVSVRPDGSDNTSRKYQRRNDTFAAEFMSELAANDDLGNIQSLIEVSTESLAHYVPEFRSARYDFRTGTFRNSEGAPISDEVLDGWASKHPRVRAARAGRRTLKRGILFNTLARTEGGERSGLLEQVLQQPGKLVGDNLEGTFYRRDSALDEQKVQSLLPELRKRLDKLMIRNVDLRFDPAMSEQGATEISPNDDIAILIGAALNDVATLNHEVIHVLRARNLFKDGEWSALREAADKEWLKRYNIAERYGDLDREGQIEEAVAEAFADWTQGNLDLTDKAKGPMAKIRRFFKALMETLRGQGVTSPADIFKAIDAGDVGARDGAMPADMTRKFQRPATAMKTDARQALADATNTATVPDRRIWDEAVRRNGNLLNRAGGAKGAIMDSIDELRVEFQDMMLPLLRAEQAIAAVTGQEISKAESAYYAEERYTGRVGRRLDVLREEYTEPMAYMIAQSDAPIKLTDQNGQVREGADAVDLWLTARHAEERNALVQQRDPNMTSGSGMTDAEAQAVLKQASGQPFMPVLQRIGDMADRLGQDMIQWREDAGLLSTTEANAWRAMFKHYVPLKGFAETDMYDAIANEPTVRRGRKYNVTGKEAKAITGRSSEAFSPLATMLAMAEEVTVRAEKNLVMQSFYNLATKYPNPAMWKTQDVKTKRVFNRNTGRVETRLMDAAQTNLGPNEIALKINGEEKRIELVDPRLEKALSSVGAVPQFNRITRAASAFSRFFSSVNTMLSPPFVIVNAFRDMITAQFNLGQLPKEIRGKVKKAAVRDWIKAFSGSYQGLGDTNAQGEWAQYFHEFAESGAKVSFFKLELPGARQHEFAKQIKLNTGNKIKRSAKKLKRANTQDNPVLKVIERLNLAVDNAVRLSVFMEARKQGMTIEEASSLSKNLTVNFNRKGSATAVANAWFPFFNAAVQGSQVIFKATTHKRVAASVAGATVLGLALDLLNAYLSEPDEDGELKYDKIPNYIGERNLIIPGPGDSYFTIPLPYGYNAFFYAGQQMGKTMRGVKDADEAALDTVSAAFAGFSPLSGESVTQTVMPTLGDHLLELVTNKDWLGRPIRPENPWDDTGPQSQKMYKNEPPEVYQKVATGLNALTGGDEGRAGWLDVSPEYLHHTAKFLGGGAGRFADRMIETGTNLARGDTDLIEAHRVPLARVLHYSHGDWLNQGRYFDFKTEVEKAEHDYETKRESRNLENVSEETLKAVRLRGHLKLAEQRRESNAKKIKSIYANPYLTDQQRRDRLNVLYDRRNDIYVTFNKRFIDIMGPQAE